VEARLTQLEAERSRDKAWGDARDHIHEYFKHTTWIGMNLVALKDDALKRFGVATSAEYNKEDPSSLSILSLALSLVPEAAALGEVFHVLKDGAEFVRHVKEEARELSRFEEGVKVAGKTAKALNEAAKGGVEIAKGAGEVGEAHKAATEGQALGDFTMEQINSVAALRVQTINSFWEAEKAVLDELQPRAEAGADLSGLLARNFKIPERVPDEPGLKLSYEYELLLYRDWFKTRGLGFRPGGGRSRLDLPMTGEGTYRASQWLDYYDIPEKLKDHIEREIKPKIPNAWELVLDEAYEKAQAEARDRQAREARFNEGMETRLFGLPAAPMQSQAGQ
jgi:hypothetical protein